MQYNNIILGVAFVAKILCRGLKNDQNIRVENEILIKKHVGSTNERDLLENYAPKDNLIAVIAQFDKLSLNMRIILKISSMIGNFNDNFYKYLKSVL